MNKLTTLALAALLFGGCMATDDVNDDVTSQESAIEASQASAVEEAPAPPPEEDMVRRLIFACSQSCFTTMYRCDDHCAGSPRQTACEFDCGGALSQCEDMCDTIFGGNP